MIVAAMGKTEAEALVHIQNRPGQDLRYSVDSSKIRALGWAPKTKLHDYIPTYIKLYRKHLGL